MLHLTSLPASPWGPRGPCCPGGPCNWRNEMCLLDNSIRRYTDKNQGDACLQLPKLNKTSLAMADCLCNGPRIYDHYLSHTLKMSGQVISLNATEDQFLSAPLLSPLIIKKYSSAWKHLHSATVMAWDLTFLCCSRQRQAINPHCAWHQPSWIDLELCSESLWSLGGSRVLQRHRGRETDSPPCSDTVEMEETYFSGGETLAY